MHLIDHTDPNWLNNFTRMNGAFTYSQDLVKYQVPHWEKYLGDDGLISTCPKLSDTDVRGHYKTAIQYLHSFPYISPVRRVRDILMNRTFKADKLIFITAYKAFEKLLIKEGLKAVYIPMAIDVKAVSKYKVGKNHIDDKLIYFGNIVHNKVTTFRKVSKACLAKGYTIDVISIGKLNGTTVTSQKDAWKLASNYKYGIGVGRCAQELHALGVKTIIAGPRFGGLITNEEEYKEQLRTNMNGRYWTYNSDPRICIENIDKSRVYNTDIKNLNHAERVASFYNI